LHTDASSRGYGALLYGGLPISFHDSSRMGFAGTQTSPTVSLRTQMNA